MAGLLDEIKRAVENAGKSRKSIWYCKAGQKKKVRFLTNFENATTIPWHQLYKDGNYVVNTPCLEQYGKVCPFCDNENLKNAPFYAWSVWDYDSKERQVFLFKVSNASPIPHLVSVYENKGTLLDRDFMISRKGEKADTLYSVDSEDKSRDRTGAKPFRLNEMLKLIWEANGTGSLKKDYEDLEEEEIEESEEDDIDEEDELEDDEEFEEEEIEEEPPPKRKKPVVKVPVKAQKRR